MTESELLIPATQAAKKLGISRQTLRRLIHRKAIKAVKIGNVQRLYIPQAEIVRIISGESIETAVEGVPGTKPATGQDNLSSPPQPFPMGATRAKTVIASGSSKEPLEAMLADLHDGPDEYLTPEEADAFNAQERERVREVQATMAANPCITFSGIPTMRIWRAGEIKPTGEGRLLEPHPSQR